MDYVSQYLRKGDRVYIEGKVQTRKWQVQSGKDRYSTEIVVNSIGGQLLGLSSRTAGYSTKAKSETSGEIKEIHIPDLGDVPF